MNAQAQHLDASRKELNKTFKPIWIWAIAFGASIGWGSFVLPATWMSAAGPAGVIIGFTIGAILLSTIGISTGYLIRAHPVTGGAFTYSYLGFGRYHAFFCGWFLLLGYIAIIALNASAMGLLFRFLAPDLIEQGYLYPIAGWNVYIVEVILVTVVLVVFALLTIRGSATSGRIQFWLCVVLLGGTLAVFLGMAVSPSTSFSNLQPAFHPHVGIWNSIAAMVAISPWAYIGFDSVPQTAEEFNFAPRKATALILGALGVAALQYAIMIIATGWSSMPWQHLVSRHEVWGTGFVVEQVLGSTGLVVLIVALCMGIFTGLIGFYVSSSRLMFAMSRAKALPPVFSCLHRKHGTPYVGILFCCVVCMTAPWFGRAILLWVVNMSAVGVSVAFLYYSLVAYKSFTWKNGTPTKISCKVGPRQKLVALIGTIVSIAFICLLIIPGSPGALHKPEWIALVLWLILGCVIFAIYGGDYRHASKEELDHLILGKGQ